MRVAAGSCAVRPGPAGRRSAAKLAELAPWYVPFALGDRRVNTMEFTDNFGAAIFADDNAQRMQFRTELIGGTLGRLLGDELGAA